MDILFWSGGKDAFLAHEFYQKKNSDRSLKLLTTYNEKTGIVPHQHITVEKIKHQAKSLSLEYVLISLPEKCPNDLYIEKVDRILKKQSEPVENLIFGDWHLRDIRDWREEQFTPSGYHCLFPIWGKSMHDLLPELLLKPVEVRISAVSKEFEQFIRVGELYNQRFVRQLPEEIDPMGEKGEFHTEVIFKKWHKLKQENQPLY